MYRAGLSRTLKSKHLTGHAFDVDVKGYSRDRVPDYVWHWLHRLAHSLNLKTIGWWDRGHFEI